MKFQWLFLKSNWKVGNSFLFKAQFSSSSSSNSCLPPIVREYLGVKERHPNAFVLYQIGDFYEVFGEDAIKFSAIADVQLCKGTETRKKIPMTGVPVRSAEIYMEKALKKGYSLAIYDQFVETVAGQENGKIKRKISRLITPGTVVEQQLLSSVRSRWLLAVCVKPKSPEEDSKNVSKEVFKAKNLSNESPKNLSNEPSNSSLIQSSCSSNEFSSNFNSISTCWTDISTGTVYWNESCRTIEDFARLLAILNPVEILFDANSLDSQHEIVSKAKAIPHSFVKVDAEISKQSHSLLIGAANVETIQEELQKIPALQVLIGHLWSESICTSPVLHLPLVHFDSSKKMLLDSSVLLALELFKSSRSRSEEDSNLGTLFSCLNACRTSKGSRLLAERLMQPSRVREEIEFRLDFIEAFSLEYFSSQAFDELQRILDSFPDIERSLQRVLLGKSCGLIVDLQKICRALTCAIQIQELLLECKDFETAKLLDSNDSSLSTPKKQFNHIFSYLQGKFANFSPLLGILQNAIIIDDDSPIASSSRLEEGNFIKSGFDSELDSLKSENDHIFESLKILELKYRKQTANYSLKIITDKKTLGWFVECSSALMEEASSLLKDDENSNSATLSPQKEEFEFKFESSSARSFRYRTPKLDELYRQHSTLTERIISRELQVFQEIRKLIADYATKIKNLASVIAELDLSCTISRIPSLIRPTFISNSPSPQNSGKSEEPMEIKDAFHPVVARNQTRQFKNFVTNDISLNSSDFLLITGPNMGGKSTFLRQTAIISIMAQAGLFVPASKANLRIFDNVFCRIGSADDISRDQSTFMLEMYEVGQIFQRASPNSLILLDEVGRGTSYQDGLALTIAICKHLIHNIRGTVLFATHYHELDGYLPKEPLVKRLKSEAFVGDSQRNFVFSYKIVPGSSKESFGIEVAGLAGIPVEVLQEARHHKANFNE